MSEFGIKILNIEASTIFEHNNGVRERYDYKEAMFVNSLFSDYLLANGLKITKSIYPKREVLHVGLPAIRLERRHK